jgi:hypothetical protein
MSIYDIATLADQLAELYPTPEDSRRVVKSAGISIVEITFDGRPRDNWWGILQVTAYHKGSLAGLLVLVLREFPDNPLLFQMHEEIKASDERKTTEPDPPKPPDEKESRTSLWKKFQQWLRIFKPMIHQPTSADPQLAFPDTDLDWFQKLMAVSQAVGMIRTPTSAVTAIMLKNGYVLTFFLELKPEEISNLQLILYYDSETEPELNQQILVPLTASVLHQNRELWYTLLRRETGHPSFDLFAPVQHLAKQDGHPIHLISHPLGMSKRISGGQIIRTEDEYLYYTSESHAGSAGGPVIQDHHVIAMHAGRTEEKDPTGEPVKQGILIARILQDAGLDPNQF